MSGKILNTNKMPKTTDRLLRKALLLLAVCAGIACAITWHFAGIPLNNVYGSLWDGKKWYGMDRSGGNIMVFSSDLDGGNCRIVYVSRSGDDTFRIGEKISLTADGQCQATFLEYTGSADIKRYTGICDFETGLLDNIQEETAKPEEDLDGIYQSARTEDGQVWYVDRDGSVWHKWQGGKKECILKCTN